MDTVLKRGPLTIADLPDDEVWPRHELIDGGLHVTPHADAQHQAVVMRLIRALDRALLPGHQLYSPLNVVRGQDTLLIPDLVVTNRDLGSVLGAAPEDCVLVVEVLSPSTRRYDLSAKRSLFREWGVSAWFVDPLTSGIEADGAAYRDIDLPGFTLS